ncbi:MAG: pilus assembly protein TadG-related protein [Pyrinomonadaceae bacterium]
MRKHLSDERSGERGSIMVMTAVLMLGLVLCIGLTIDVSRIYMLRTELQNAADAAALAGARELNSGITGINDAASRAAAIVNTEGFDDTGVSVATVEFAINLNGSYISKATFDAMSQSAKQTFASDARFIRVTTQATSIDILFAAQVLGATRNESAVATAGMSVGLNTICDFFPIAVALNNPSPAPGTQMNLTFTQGTGNSATLNDMNYIILEVPDISGNGAPETAVLSAGLTNICKSINAQLQFHMTPSANVNNGPRQLEDGVNTRFNVYANGYGNALKPDTFPPDSNVNQTINFSQYISGSPLTAPNPNAPGQDGRRILIAPIVAPGTYSPPTTNIVKFGVFFLKKKTSTQNPCSRAGNICARLEVEYIGDDITMGRGFYDPNNAASSSLTIAVLYR